MSCFLTIDLYVFSGDKLILGIIGLKLTILSLTVQSSSSTASHLGSFTILFSKIDLPLLFDECSLPSSSSTAVFLPASTVQFGTVQVRKGQVRAGQVKTGQVKTVQVRTGQIRPCLVRTGN